MSSTSTSEAGQATRLTSAIASSHDAHYNISKHVRILREAGILATDKKGKDVECRVADKFHSRLRRNENILGLGCCTFRFDLPAK